MPLRAKRGGFGERAVFGPRVEPGPAHAPDVPAWLPPSEKRRSRSPCRLCVANLQRPTCTPLGWGKRKAPSLVLRPAREGWCLTWACLLSCLAGATAKRRKNDGTSTFQRMDGKPAAGRIRGGRGGQAAFGPVAEGLRFLARPGLYRAADRRHGNTADAIANNLAARPAARLPRRNG